MEPMLPNLLVLLCRSGGRRGSSAGGKPLWHETLAIGPHQDKQLLRPLRCAQMIIYTCTRYRARYFGCYTTPAVTVKPRINPRLSLAAMEIPRSSDLDVVTYHPSNINCLTKSVQGMSRQIVFLTNQNRNLPANQLTRTSVTHNLETLLFQGIKYRPSTT